MKLYDYEKKHLQQVRRSAAECTVLLKSNGKFPLKKPCAIAAYGSGVRHTVKGGTGSGEVNSRFSINVEKGLTDAGFRIKTNKWLRQYDKVRAQHKKDFIKQVKKEARKAHQQAYIYAMGKVTPEPEYDLTISGDADVAIYVLSRISGEGNDRDVIPGDVKLTDSEINDILALDYIYDKFMLVLNVGGVVDLSPVAGVSNILLLSQLGVVTGTVLADILLGKQNPSGKLATTWSAWEDYCKVGDFGDEDETRYKEGIYVGYRYFDSVGKEALYPFGYGLSYTTFDIDAIRVNADFQTKSGVRNGIEIDDSDGRASAGKDSDACQDRKETDHAIRVSATVTNTGKFAGKEVVQAYVSLPSGKLDQPYQMLAGYAKTALLKPGESDEVEISFTLPDLASYDEAIASYILEKGSYVLRVGNSSVNTEVAAVLKLSEDVITCKAKNCLGKADFTDWKPADDLQAEEIKSIRRDAEREEDEYKGSIPVIQISADHIRSAEINDVMEYSSDDKIKALSDEELVYLNIGYFNPNAKGFAVVGNAAGKVAGAAGETTEILEEKGIPALVMADGPAGLRLTKQYYKDGDKAIGVGNAGLPESFLDYMSKPMIFIMKRLFGSAKPPKDAEIKDQYTTAIPIGTAVAQSFNYALEKMYGDIVGDEMERFGVHLWLAPALNIHRSIRCGRNFEYFSEDPLVAGLTAAALTEGVQSHAGRGVTIKHYAANNAETQRYTNNSQVSERAMREIYLKGFGICVKKSQPHALMTSYNLVNGVHTAEHRGLIEDILRNEFGFRGIVMTDWIVAMMAKKDGPYRGTIAKEVLKAGGDLFMPGSKADFNQVLQALQDGEISREQLEINGSRVYRMCLKLINEI